MRKNVIATLLAGLLLPYSGYAFNSWKRVDTDQAARLSQNIKASASLVYATDEAALKTQLFSLSKIKSEAQVITLPMPDGSMKDFKVWHSPMMPDELAARYPELRTFTGYATDDPSVSVKLDYTVYGFHAMVFDGKDVSFIDPSDDQHSGYYTVHYKKNETRQSGQLGKCAVVSNSPQIKDRSMNINPAKGYRTVNGNLLRTYRLALACSHQYAQAATGIASPTLAQVFSKMVTSMNRVNGVYEREVSVTMVFVAKEDTLIWPTDPDIINGSDPYGTVNNDAAGCLSMNQTVCDERIGDANYDIGHVFTTGAGGLSQIGVVCLGGSKALSATGQPAPVGDGFDIDYVAHEMGHEYGATHPFNNGVDGSCGGGNIETTTAYEPGSGSTIMAYAGICYPDDLQPHSDDYFHAISLMRIHDYITDATRGDLCPVRSATLNKMVNLPSFNTSYTIPFLTPFELIAPVAIDSVADTSTTYCWEQWNLGDFNMRLIDTHLYGPIFRSYLPVKSQVRIFPENSMVLSDTLSNAGHENAEGEKAPDSARYLTFRLTVRDVFQGNGCFLIPDDTIHLNVINTGKGFAVTSQGDSTDVFVGGSSHTITWDVVGTDVPPVNAQNVDIYMSEDGGNTWPNHIGAFPNTGSVSVPFENPATSTTQARIKVKGNGNVFFNVNRYNFSITHHVDGGDTLINLYPNPTHHTLRVASGNKGLLNIRIYNSIGKEVYTGQVDGLLDIFVDLWPRGVYILKFEDADNHRTIRKFVVD